MFCETFSLSTILLPVVCILPETTWRRPSLSAEAPQRPLARQNSSPYGKNEPLFSYPSIFWHSFWKCYHVENKTATEDAANRRWHWKWKLKIWEKYFYKGLKGQEWWRESDGKLGKELSWAKLCIHWVNCTLFMQIVSIWCYRSWLNVSTFFQTDKALWHSLIISSSNLLITLRLPWAQYDTIPVHK